MTTNKSDTHKRVGTMMHVHRVVPNEFDHEADLDVVIAMIENLGWQVEELKLGEKGAVALLLIGKSRIAMATDICISCEDPLDDHSHDELIYCALHPKDGGDGCG